LTTMVAASTNEGTASVMATRALARETDAKVRRDRWSLIVGIATPRASRESHTPRSVDGHDRDCGYLWNSWGSQQSAGDASGHSARPALNSHRSGSGGVVGRLDPARAGDAGEYERCGKHPCRHSEGCGEECTCDRDRPRGPPRWAASHCVCIVRPGVKGAGTQKPRAGGTDSGLRVAKGFPD
jgi:hypothetical protein